MIISGDDPVSRGVQRFEVFTGAGRRRDWPPEIKASIVAECGSGREGVSAVARRYGLDPSQVYAWRKDLRQKLEDRQLADKGLPLPTAAPEAATFVPAIIEPDVVPDLAPVRRTRRRRRATVAAAAVELEIDGVAVKIGRGADAGMIAAVIEALKATRSAEGHAHRA
jgi:transposase